MSEFLLVEQGKKIRDIYKDGGPQSQGERLPMDLTSVRNIDILLGPGFFVEVEHSKEK